MLYLFGGAQSAPTSGTSRIGSLLEMQNLGPHPRLLNWKLWKGAQESVFLTSPLRDS